MVLRSFFKNKCWGKRQNLLIIGGGETGTGANCLIECHCHAFVLGLCVFGAAMDLSGYVCLWMELFKVVDVERLIEKLDRIL